jgi:uncharacterized RDD family membrane protein YckC
MSEPPLPPPGNFPPPGNYPPPGYYPPPGVYPPPGGYPPAGGYYAPVPGAPGTLPKEAYTSWITRVAAYFIDTLPVAALAGVGQALGANDCVSETGSGSYNFSCVSHPSGLTYVMWLLAIAFAVWNYGYRQGTTGSSIGKSVMKFKVVAERTGQPIGFGKSILRQFAHIADAIICNIGYLFPLWDAKRQTIADKIMSTICLPL